MSAKLGKLVKEARTAKGLSQAALAQKVEGLTASDVSKIERGEKEPSQAILKKMAAPLGVTQKSLLEALSGTGSTGKTSSGASSSAKKKTGSSASESLTLTATEKKLVRLYRSADTAAKKAAMSILSGDGNILEVAAAMLSGKTGGQTASSSSGKNNELLENLMQAFLKK